VVLVASPSVSDGELLATAGNDGSLRLGNTKGTQFDTIPMLQSPTLQDQIKSVVFSPDGKLLATIGNNKVKLWRISEKDSTIENIHLTHSKFYPAVAKLGKRL
jgi:WD40 repeat protein